MSDKFNPEAERLKSKRQIKEGIASDLNKLRELGLYDSVQNAIGWDMEGGVGDAAANSSAIFDQAADRAAQMIASDTYLNPNSPASKMVENYSNSARMEPYIGEGGYKPQMVIKENSTGREITKWRVMDPNGKTINKDYRHREAASMVAAALNENNGNLNDPRIQKIDQFCAQEVSLLREIKTIKQHKKETPRGNTTKHDILETKLDTARTKLENVRAKLGVLCS